MLKILVSGITDNSTIHTAGDIVDETPALAALADGTAETRPGKPNYHPWHVKHGKLVERISKAEARDETPAPKDPVSKK